MYDFNQDKPYKFRNLYIPQRMLKSLDLYINNHIPPGDFLRSVICNNLIKAANYADDENLINLGAYIGFLVNNAPNQCYGSLDNYLNWINMRKNND